jgi:uncharacterized protein YjbI with pentapeptide repeats
VHTSPTRRSRILKSVAAMGCLVVFVARARADIFQWEYINPADPSQGKQQSTILTPDGAGVDAVPGANLSFRNLTMAYLIGADLTGAGGYYINLSDADLSQANLTNVNFAFASLAGADLTDAVVQGAAFDNTGLTHAQLYSTASYQAHDLAGIGLGNVNLTGGNFAGQNLTNARFDNATLTDADFTGAEMRGANLSYVTSTGFTLAQLYSTASYQAHDLRGIILNYNDLTGGNFAGQDLTNAYFYGAALTDADFAGANVRGANFAPYAGCVDFSCPPSGTGITLPQLYSTASYQAHDLSGVVLDGSDLAGGNFAGQNLTNALLSSSLINADFSHANVQGASFDGATLTNADFTGANVLGADFARLPIIRLRLIIGTGITPAQLYTTASYQARDLSGVGFGGNLLAGVNFVGQNLANASFRSCVSFYCVNATLSDANLTAADARGAWSLENSDLSGATTTNLIWPDGRVDGLNLDSGGLVVVRDYDWSIPILVDQHLAMGPGGTLRMVFEADAWDSTISFAPGIPVTLGGTLELTFAADVNLASQVGRTFDLFDWTGVNPTGVFTVASRYVWDFSSLYTTGDVMLLAIPDLAGDFNHDGTVDAADYIIWRKNFSGDQTTYDAWRTNFGRTLSAGSGSVFPSTEPLSAAVPEPTAFALAALVLVRFLFRRKRINETASPLV